MSSISSNPLCTDKKFLSADKSVFEPLIPINRISNTHITQNFNFFIREIKSKRTEAVRATASVLRFYTMVWWCALRSYEGAFPHQ